jgi:heat shock protein HtpX
MKRTVLFLLTNLAVMLVLSVVLSALGVNRFLTGTGLNIPMLLVFSLVVGFTGSHPPIEVRIAALEARGAS